jgi:hypothetical protein
MVRFEDAEARALSIAWAVVASGLRMPDGSLEKALSEPRFLREVEGALKAIDPGDVEGLRGAWARYRAVAADVGRVGLVKERSRVLGRSALEREVPLAVQAEVLALFSIQRGFALGRGEDGHATILRDEERRSLRGRVGRLLPLFLERTEAREPGGSLAALARLASGIAALHSRALGVTPPARRAARPAREARPGRRSLAAALLLVPGTYMLGEILGETED